MGTDASNRIDRYIASLGDWRGDMAARLRKLINSADPNLTEEWKWETPVWSSNGNVCAVGVFKDAVKVNFFKGASLPDPHHVFNGGLDAKTSRSIDLKKGDRVNETALKELVKAAAAMNRGKR